MDTPTPVFAGQTESKRIALAQLSQRDGETFIVVKTFMPIPEDFREDFPDDKGIFPGGEWEVLPTKAEDGSPSDGSLFKSEAYTLQYALWLIGALSAGIQAAGGWEQLRGKVERMVAGEDGEPVWMQFEELIEAATKTKEV